MLTAGSLVLVPAALLVDGLPAAMPSPATWMALAYLALVASAVAYICLLYTSRCV